MGSQETLIRTVFLGTPEFAVGSLEALVCSEAIDVQAVITQPDKPAGRGQKLTPSPIKTRAAELALPIFQPLSLKTLTTTEEGIQGSKSSAALAEFLNSVSPIDALICVAYGKIIPPPLLWFAKFGIINVHPSLLPRWRGAAPIQRAVYEGDSVTGVSIMQLDQGVDSGPVYVSEELPITDEDTSGTLHDKLSGLGARLLVESLPRIRSGELVAKDQSSQGTTYAEKWEKEDILIRWDDEAEVTRRRISASAPRPGARCQCKGELLKVFAASVTDAPGASRSVKPGTIVVLNQVECLVACGKSSYIALQEVQFPGKRRINATELYQGRQFKVGDVLGEGKAQ